MRKNNNLSELGKVPPQAIDLEEAILGALLIESEALPKVYDLLKKETFYKEHNQIIYGAITSLYDDKEPIDILTVTNRLRKNGNLDIIGGAYYVTQLTSRVASASNLEYWCRVVIQKWMQREVIRLTSEMQTRAFDDNEDILYTLDYYSLQIKNIQEQYTQTDETPEDLIKQAKKEAYKRANNYNKGIPNCIASPVESINKKIAGAERGEVIVIAARPSMGKTQFALKWAERASKDGHKPLFITLEMTAKAITNRRICSEGGINSFNIRTGELSIETLKNYDSSADRIEKNPVYIVSASDLNSVKNKIIRYVNKYGCEIAFIDYLQLIKHEGKNDNSEIGKISRELNLLAKELDIPIILISQLSRMVEQRGGLKIPMLSDLRDSGTIEQDADLIMFLWRPGYYGIDTFKYSGETFSGMDNSDIFAFIPKFRNGAVNYVRFKCTDRMAGFKDYIPEVFTNKITSEKEQEEQPF